MVRRVSALPLLPLDKVEDVWAETIADSPQDDKVTLLMDYVTNTWIEGPWNPEMWNHFGNGNHRTNNHLEGWHHKINQVAKKSHPNIFEVVGLLKREQSSVEVKLQQLHGHWQAPARKRTYRIIDARIQSLKDDLIRNNITEMQYTDHIGELLHFN